MVLKIKSNLLIISFLDLGIKKKKNVGSKKGSMERPLVNIYKL